MNPLFSGITCLQGPKMRVKQALHAAQDADAGVVIARVGDRGMILDGRDADVFIKKHYGVTVPEEFKGKTLAEAQDLYYGDLERYAELPEQLAPLHEDFLQFLARVMIYVEYRKSVGTDIEGNPIRYRDV